MKGKKLYFGMSVALPLEEAVAFKKSLGNEDKYFLMKVRDNPKDVHVDRRQRYMVLREPREGEYIPAALRVFAGREKLW